MGDAIRLRGIQQNNLKNFDLDIPTQKLTVITGVSGSGKSSLAFDTLFAEGQRRYIETFSPYARQFFDRMDKPRVDRVEGIPPAIAIEQKNTVKSTRSTVGTMTEICDFMKVLWPHFSRPYCGACGNRIEADHPESVWQYLRESGSDSGIAYVVFSVAMSEALGVAECLKAVQGQGYQRCILDGTLWVLEDLLKSESLPSIESIWVVQDRLRLPVKTKARVVEACEQAFDRGHERLAVAFQDGPESKVSQWQHFSRLLACSDCGETVTLPTRSTFSFNSPVGACPACRGFGRVIGIDYRLAISDPSLSLAGGAVKLWQKGHGLRSQSDMMRAAKRDGISTRVPFAQLSAEAQRWVLYGHPDHGIDEQHRWPKSWYGVKGYFDWLETKAYKMHVRVLLARYRVYRLCPDCSGTRFKPEVLRFQIPLPGEMTKQPDGAGDRRLNLAEFYGLSVGDATEVVAGWSRQRKRSASDPLSYALDEVRSRLQFLCDVGLAYLTLDRPTKTLSGGETERINLTSCLGTRLVNTLFVLDEPSVGLHAVDVKNLIRILQRLRDAGNTVVVVEHETALMEAADRVLDIGPGSGADGGQLVFSGTVRGLHRCRPSITGQYLRGEKRIEGEVQRRPASKQSPKLTIEGASGHNIRNLSIDIPLNHLVCITGVSGSGKTTLVKEILVPKLQSVLSGTPDSGSSDGEEEGPESDSGEACGRVEAIRGYQGLDSVYLVDQSPVGKTPRSSPALYVGIFEDIRKLFAASPKAEAAGLTAGVFSFNSRSGQCERCRGAGFEKIEMQFLSDVYVRCPSCDGKRYRQSVREFELDLADLGLTDTEPGHRNRWTIDAMLEASVDEVHAALGACQHRAARRAVLGLEWLQAVGLGYLQLGQPINTLSGGESQRLKVVRHLNVAGGRSASPERSLFVFDEPTTGLHLADVAVLVAMFRNMLEKGHSVVVIEHHLELIAASDWVVDLGPGAGENGGRLVASGAPEDIMSVKESKTGQCLGARMTGRLS